MKFLLYLPVCMLTLMSCAEKSYSIEDLSSMPVKEIHGTQVTSDIVSPGFQSITQVGNHLMLSYTSFSENAYVFVNPATGKIEKRLGGFGDGPEDFISQMQAGVSATNDSIHVFDLTRMHSYEYVWDSSQRDYTFQKGYPCKFKEPSFLLEIKRMQNGNYVGQLFGGKDSMFVLFDREMNELTRFGHVPLEGLTSDQVDFMPLRGHITTVGNQVYFFMHNFAYMARYDILPSGAVNQVWEYFLTEPKYKVENGSSIKILGHDNHDGFFGVLATEEYIYALYSGVYSSKYRDTDDPNAQVPNTLLVFNPEGEIVRKCHFKDKGAIIGVSSDKKTVYIDAENPEPTIMAYKAEDIFK